jgi:hypothetical protein
MRMIARLSRRLVVTLLGAALGLIALWGAITFLHPSIGPSIRGVSPDRLSRSGIVLINPFPWDQPLVSDAAARQIAIQQGGGGPVLQAVLSEVVLTNPSTRAPRLCWVVSLPGSLVASNGPPGSAPIHATFYVVLIDAKTGDFVEGDAGS